MCGRKVLRAVGFEGPRIASDAEERGGFGEFVVRNPADVARGGHVLSPPAGG
jgi:hypothetical protein